MLVLDYEKPQQAGGSNRAEGRGYFEIGIGIGRRKPGFEAKGEKERGEGASRERVREEVLITVPI